MDLFAKGFFLTADDVDWFHENYAAGVDRADPRLSPLVAADLSGLAPALVVTAGFDPLRDEGEAYADLLTAHGVPVTRKRYASMIHGFFNMVGVGREARAHNSEIAAALARTMA
jgi:acetyl esterase